MMGGHRWLTRMGARDAVGFKPAMEIEMTREGFGRLSFVAEMGELLHAWPIPTWPFAMVSSA